MTAQPDRTNMTYVGPQDDYAVAEWWQSHRIIRGEELRGIERRMERRGITTDEAIGPRPRVTLTVIRGGQS